MYSARNNQLFNEILMAQKIITSFMLDIYQQFQVEFFLCTITGRRKNSIPPPPPPSIKNCRNWNRLIIWPRLKSFPFQVVNLFDMIGEYVKMKSFIICFYYSLTFLTKENTELNSDAGQTDTDLIEILIEITCIHIYKFPSLRFQQVLYDIKCVHNARDVILLTSCMPSILF